MRKFTQHNITNMALIFSSKFIVNTMKNDFDYFVWRFEIY